MESSSAGEESDVDFTQRTRAMHRTRSGLVTSAEEEVKPGKSCEQQEKGATSLEGRAESAEIELYEEETEEEEGGVKVRSPTVFDRMVQNMLKKSREREEKEEEKQKRGETRSSQWEEEAEKQDSDEEQGRRSSVAKRRRVSIDGDVDEDLDSVGEQDTQSEEGEGERRGASSVGKR